MSYLEILEKSRDLLLGQTPFCTVTIVDRRGSIPQVPGGKAVFSQDGLVCGTVGGGRLEKRAQEIALEMITRVEGEKTRLLAFNLLHDLGMTCGGEVTLFFECQGGRGDWTIVLFGAGHVAQALCRLLVTLDCNILVFDTRPDWLAALPASPRLHSRQVGDLAKAAEQVPEGADVVIMSIGHAEDRAILSALSKLKHTLPYVGVIGSKSKAASLRNRLREDGIAKPFIDKMVCPVGEKVGNNTPAEIAIGIASQLLKKRRGCE
ncbi:MAG: xanthine dehydrogenase accessory protein XdhC [Rhodospirillales bacterium]|nr:MAG: xanthine dehydrogenase accessory protein XdhC [Rhodospirillales bacterium]